MNPGIELKYVAKPNIQNHFEPKSREVQGRNCLQVTKSLKCTYLINSQGLQAKARVYNHFLFSLEASTLKLKYVNISHKEIINYM